MPEETGHISIIGLTGSGKSYLVRHGILPLVKWDRVLILDMKGDDRTLRGLGKPVKQLPTWQRSLRQMIMQDEPMGNWYRLKVFDNIDHAQLQVHEALSRIWREGEWILVVDEVRALIDTPSNGWGLNMGNWWNRIMMRGRSRGIGVINNTQEPAWVKSLFYTQASFTAIGKIEDVRAHKRIGEIGAHPGMIPHLPTIKNRRFLFTDNLEDERWFAKTGL